MPEEIAAPSVRRVRRRIAPSSSGHDIVTALLPVLACFLGGATEKWAEGIVVLILGLLLLVAPPRFSLGPVANILLLALLASAAAAFLPAAWFHQPAWRIALTNDFGVTLPVSATAQPWVSAGCFASFLAGVSWFYYISTQRLEGRSIRRQFRIFAGSVTLLAALCIALYLANTALPFWHNPRGFGPFANRNQTANLFGLAAIIVVACGHDDLRLKKIRWIFWLVALGILITALVLNFSRAGLLILIGGIGLWLAILILRSRSAGTIAIGASLLLVLLTAVLLFGGATLERFNLRAPQGLDVPSEFRWLIFQDAFRLMRDSPWCGIGLGNFEPVFAVFRDASVVQRRALHPESDWFWLASEAGWPAVIFLVVSAGFLARRVFPLSEGTAQRIRLAALIAGLFFALHGLVDVGGHRVGTAWAGLFLFGLALRRPGEDRASRSVSAIFRANGVLLIGIGALWLVASYRQMSVPGTLGADNERRLAAAANVGRQYRETIARASEGLAGAPLDWQLYFLRALGEVGGKLSPDLALADFRRARFLEPISMEVPYQEGLAWLPTQPGLAITAWSESLRRARPERQELYGRMLMQADRVNKPVRQTLLELGGGEPDLALVYLERAGGDDFAQGLGRLLAVDPVLATLTPEQRSRLFVLWSERGSAAQLATFMEAHPDMLDFGWRGLAKEKATARDFRAAYEMAQRFGPRPALPQITGNTSSEALQRALLGDPNDYLAALALYQQQMQTGKTNDALITVRRLTEKPTAPPYFHFLEAEAWAASGNWERAWTAWRAYEGGAAK
ncbi:MAG: O-antigen ligase family protein [Chthoniobacterales bacterium]